MNYQQIHAALTESAESGEVCRIMRSFIDYNLVLTAKTEQYAWDWLGYSPIDAELKPDGQLPTFYEITHAAVNGYCREFIVVHCRKDIQRNSTCHNLRNWHRIRQQTNSVPAATFITVCQTTSTGKPLSSRSISSGGENNDSILKPGGRAGFIFLPPFLWPGFSARKFFDSKFIASFSNDYQTVC